MDWKKYYCMYFEIINFVKKVGFTIQYSLIYQSGKHPKILFQTGNTQSNCVPLPTEEVLVVKESKFFLKKK